MFKLEMLLTLRTAVGRPPLDYLNDFFFSGCSTLNATVAVLITIPSTVLQPKQIYSDVTQRGFCVLIRIGKKSRYQCE